MSWYTNVELSKLLNSTQDTHLKNVIAHFRPRDQSMIDTFAHTDKIQVIKGEKVHTTSPEHGVCTILRGVYVSSGGLMLNEGNEFDFYEMEFIVADVMHVKYKYQVRRGSGRTVFFHVHTNVDRTKQVELPTLATLAPPPMPVLELPTVIAAPPPAAVIELPLPTPVAVLPTLTILAPPTQENE